MPLPLRSSTLIASLGLLGLAGACADPVASPLAPRTPGVPTARADLAPAMPGSRYIVELAEGASTLSADALVASGGTLVDAVPVVNGVVVDGVTAPDALIADPNVRSVLPDLEMQHMGAGAATVGAASVGASMLGSPADAPMYVDGTQWNMRVIRADEAWAVTSGGAGTNVCIIDSGIDHTHPELVGKVDREISFIPNANGSTQAQAIDSSGHGTHVAGTVTGNGVRIASVAPNARLFIAKVFNGTGGGGTTSRMYNAMTWCADQGADVVNMSIGFTNGLRRSTNAAMIAQFQQVANYVRDAGALLVTSSGNDDFVLPNATNVWLPAELDNVLNVGATAPVTDRRIAPGWPNVIGGTYDRKSFYSNAGVGVDVFAPGGRGSIPLWFLPRGQGSTYDAIVGPCAARMITLLGPTIPSRNGPGSAASCAGGGQYVWIQGTSMAAPHVAGMAAVLRAEIGGQRSAAVATRIEGCIKQSTDVIGPSTTFGAGRVNVIAAVNRLRSGQC
jgi:subtilisin family serine protease